MRFVWIVGIVAAVVWVGCKSDHHGTDPLKVLSADMTTDGQGITYVDGQAINTTAGDFSMANLAFEVYAERVYLGLATAQTGHLGSGEKWNYHAVAGKVGHPDWFHLASATGIPE